jgi:hypothetical protein
MGAAVEQEIRVKIKALVDGLKSVQELQSAVKSLQSQGNKKLGIDTDKPAAGAFKLVAVLRQLSPTLDTNISKAEELGKAAGFAGAGLGAAVAPVAALVAALVGVGALVAKATQSFVEYGSHVKDVQEETGLAAETITTLDAGAQLAGKSFDDLLPGIDKYLAKLSEAAHGNEEAAKTFKRFGIDAKEAIKNPDEAVKILLDTLSKYPNAAERLNVANELAGKGGKALARVVEEMGGDFRKFQEEARKWGIVLSEDDVRAADKFGDAVTIMGFKVKGILFEIARGALPELQKALDTLTGRVDDAGGGWRQFGQDAGAAIRSLIEDLAPLLSDLRTILTYLHIIDAARRSDYGEIARVLDRESRDPANEPDPSRDFYGPGGAARGGGHVNSPDKVAPGMPQPLALGDEPAKTHGGKKGGGGKSLAEKLRELRDKEAESELALRKAQQEAGFDLFKDDMDREQKLLSEKLQDRLISIAAYYAQVAKLQTAAIDNELAKQNEASAASIQEYNRALAKINGDKTKKEPEKEIERQTARNKMLGEQAKIEGEITKLNRDRAEVETHTANEARRTTEEYQRQVATLKNDLLRLTGQGADAAKHEIDERFRVVREQAVANADEAAVAVIDALKKRLKQQANFDDVEKQLRDAFQRIKDAEDAIDAEAATGAIGPQEAERRKLDAARLMRGELEQLLGELKGIAEATKDPELQAAVARLGVEVAQVGVQVDHLAQDINKDLKQALEDTLFAIIRRQQSLKDAVTSLVNHILDELARLASSAIIDKLFGENGIFGNIFNSKGGQGGIGGILSGIFGPRRAGNPTVSDGKVTVQGDGNTATEAITGVGNDLGDDLTHGFSSVGKATGEVRDVAQSGFGKIGSQFTESIGLLQSIATGDRASKWAALINLGLKFAGALAGAKGGGKDGGDIGAGGKVSGNAGGGLITGPGTDTSDSILARLSNNEFVIKAESVRRIGPRVLDYINRMGELPHYNLGGLVGELPTFNLSAAGGELHLHMHGTYPVQGGGKLTQASQAAVERDAARLARRGVQRTVASNK